MKLYFYYFLESIVLTAPANQCKLDSQFIIYTNLYLLILGKKTDSSLVLDADNIVCLVSK